MAFLISGTRISTPYWTNVKSLVVFLNELSFACENVVSAEGLLRPVLTTLATMRDAKRIRKDIIVAGSAPISGVLLGDGKHSLAGVLRGDDYREEWRLLSSLDQSSPWDAYPHSTEPGDFQEVHFQGRTAIGMLWAKQNESPILSFAVPPNWIDSWVQAQFRELAEDSNITSADIQIPNLSNPGHVTIHRNLINNYGRVAPLSSRVYEGDGFVIRMYVNDHNPPHFHVVDAYTSETVARYAIETLDLLSGQLSGVLRARVTEWARNRREDLMGCWDRCRKGQHPFFLED
jgi:hypothetical protein